MDLAMTLKNAGLLGGDNAPAAAPNPTPSIQKIPNLLDAIPGSGATPTPGVFANPPAGTAASSPNGGTAQPGIASATNPEAAKAAPTPPLTTDPSKKVIPPALQSVIDSMNADAAQNKARYDSVQNDIKSSWQNVNDLQNKIVNTPVPQMKKVTMNPLAALATLAGAGLMQNRYTPQSEQFLGGLLGGLQKNNETDYQNQSAQHNQTMQVLANAVQSAKDQGNNLRWLLPSLIKSPDQDTANIAKNLTSWYNNQNNNDTKQHISEASIDSKQHMYDLRSQDHELDTALKSLSTAPLSMRPPIAQMIRDHYVQFAGMTDQAIAESATPSPKEQELLQRKHLEGIRGDYLTGILPSQVAKNNAQAKQALAAVDRVPFENKLDDAHAQMFYKQISNYDADRAAQRAEIYDRELRNKMLTRQAMTDGDNKAFYQGIENEIKIQSDLLKTATEQQQSLLKANGGQIPNDDEGVARYRNLQTEIDGAKRNLAGLHPIHTGADVDHLGKSVLNEMYTGYDDPAQNHLQLARPQQQAISTVPKQASAAAPSGLSGPIGVVPGKQAFGLPTVQVPLQYTGGMKPTDVVPLAQNQTLSEVLANAQAKLERNRYNEKVREAVIKQLKSWGVSVQ